MGKNIARIYDHSADAGFVIDIDCHDVCGQSFHHTLAHFHLAASKAKVARCVFSPVSSDAASWAAHNIELLDILFAGDATDDERRFWLGFAGFSGDIAEFLGVLDRERKGIAFQGSTTNKLLKLVRDFVARIAEGIPSFEEAVAN